MVIKMVTLRIDEQTVSVSAGTLVVDAAKKVNCDIPVFCYHPKMEPVGMCRMCLVEIGRPVVDRATGEVVKETDGSLKIQFSPKLETACTTPVSEGMHVRTTSAVVKSARKEVLEFLLTSHPLDCPVCDKGGECPLQNLTLSYGPGQSRFEFSEKMHLQKQVPLGELIYLDRERCIQCGRCVRFAHDLAGDPVIAFHNRGRSFEIITCSEPGFDSIFSGDTTDICPVGALTTADFRFGARPWELNTAASVCNQCPVGCNIIYNVRREAVSGGGMAIKRVMPRQNEAVNEIWMCDKGRFGYHYAEAEQRLHTPFARKNGELVEVSWEEALDLAAAKLKDAGTGLIALGGGLLTNEDAFNLRQLAEAQGGRAILYSYMAGGDLTAQVGLTPGSNLGDLGVGSVIVVAAADLHEEAPVWWLRLKAASKRGATIITLGARPTRLDKYAAHSLLCDYGETAQLLNALGLGETAPQAAQAAAKLVAEAQNLVVLFGAEGLDLAGSAALAQAGADLLLHTGHAGKANNGLVGVWHAANLQGAWDMGLRPAADLVAALRTAPAVLIAAADPAGDDPALAVALDEAGFVIVQELFMTETARKADLVLPVMAVTEREGSYTNGERRVQRFYPALPTPKELKSDFVILAELGKRLGLDLEGRAAALVFHKIAEALPDYGGLSYQKLAQTEEQWPIIGRADVYYGGTGYDNHQGLGCALTNAPLNLPETAVRPLIAKRSVKDLLVVPVTKLYDHGRLLEDTHLLDGRKAALEVDLNPHTAAGLDVQDGETLLLKVNDSQAMVRVHLDESAPQGVALLPRSVGFPLSVPALGELVKQPVG